MPTVNAEIIEGQIRVAICSNPPVIYLPSDIPPHVPPHLAR